MRHDRGPVTDTIASGLPFPPEEARRFLQAKGVSPAEIDAAVHEGRLHLLVYERLILQTEVRYTESDVADLTGMPLELNRRFWRALGFPDVPPDEPTFTDADVDALTSVHGLLAMGLTDEDVAVQFARVMGSSMARVAEAQVQSAAVFTEVNTEKVAELFALTGGGSIDGMARLLEYVWRRHLLAAVRRRAMQRAAHADGVSPALVLAVGFADLVGFTALSQQLSDAALAGVVSRFEELAYDIVAAGGGRVAKMIGDEVMFVVDEPAQAARIALDLSDAYAAEEQLSNVRVGLALGAVLAREGDYFGPVVNLAHRIVNVARPGTVVVAEAVYESIADVDGLDWRPLRTRYLKDIGRVPLWSLSRSVPVPSRDDTDGEGPIDVARRRGREAMKTLLAEATRVHLEQRRPHE